MDAACPHCNGSKSGSINSFKFEYQSDPHVYTPGKQTFYTLAGGKLREDITSLAYFVFVWQATFIQTIRFFCCCFFPVSLKEKDAVLLGI